MQYLEIADWDKWQTYRNDRGTPPWIKVHRCLMTSTKWAGLTDAEKGQLVSMWIIAADKDGRIPADPAIVRKICMLDSIPNISKFTDLGYLTPCGSQSDATVTPIRKPSDAPETETYTETDKREKAKKPRAQKTKTAIPDDFTVSERVERWATEKGVRNLEAHLESFVTKARAKGYQYASWDDAFMNAIRDDWAGLNGKGKGPVTGTASSDAFWQSFEGARP